MRNSLTLRLLIINSNNHEVFTSMQWMLTLYTCLIKLVQPIKVSAFHFSRRRQTTPKCTFRGCENILKMAPLKARTELWAYSRGHLGRRRPFFVCISVDWVQICEKFWPFWSSLFFKLSFGTKIVVK